MRNKFINLLINHNKKTKNKSFLLVGDVGYSVIEDFEQLYPQYYLNVGVAEQNMASLAAGIASEDNSVFIYSIANFPTFRAAEQIRNTIDYHNYNVTVVAIGGGLEYGNLGYSHHAIQDYGLMRLFPNMTILSPGDDEELEDVFYFCVKQKGPKYLRLSKKKSFNYKKKRVNQHFNLLHKHSNPKTALISTGRISYEASKQNRFKESDIYSCPIWGEQYKKKISAILKKYKIVYCMEDHLPSSGFGSFLAECCIEHCPNTKIKRFSLSNSIIGKVGTEQELWSYSNFDQLKIE